MNLLVPLASLLGLEVDALLDQLKRSAIANLAIALFALIALTFLLVAAYVALSGPFGPIIAALMISGISLVVATAIYFVLWTVEDRRKRRAAEKRRSSETTALVTTAALTALPMLFKSSLARNIGLPLIALLTVAMSAQGKDSGRDD